MRLRVSFVGVVELVGIKSMGESASEEAHREAADMFLRLAAALPGEPPNSGYVSKLTIEVED